MKVNFAKIAKAITGISTPFFGVSWNPPVSDQEVARKLLIFLEDRRALYDPVETDRPEWVFDSIQEIRKYLTGVLDKNENSEPFFQQIIRDMRAACRKYQSIMGGSRFIGGRFSNIYGMALGEFRALFGIYLARLVVGYGLDVEEQLSAIFPITDAIEDENKPLAKKPTLKLEAPGRFELAFFFGCLPEMLDSPIGYGDIFLFRTAINDNLIECAIHFSRQIFEFCWNRKSIDQVHITLQDVEKIVIEKQTSSLGVCFRDKTLKTMWLQIKPHVRIEWDTLCDPRTMILK